MANSVDLGSALRGVRLAQIGRMLMLMCAGVWVILLNNSRIVDNLPDDVRYTWMMLPREVRVVEASLLVLVFVALQRRLMRSVFLELNYLIWALLGLSIVGVLMAPTSLVAQLQGVYAYLAPLLLFTVAWETRSNRWLISRLIGLFSIYLVFNIAMALFLQLPAVGHRGDLIHGFFSDAHAFGVFLAVGSCVAFSWFLREGGLAKLFVAIGCLLASYFPANDKMIVFNLLWFGFDLARWLVRHPLSRRGLLTAAAVAGLAVGALFMRPPELEPLFILGSLSDRQLSELGPVQSWRQAWTAITASPANAIIGFGPGNFAGLAAARAVQDQPRELGTLPRAARDALLADPGLAGGLGWSTNTWANLLAEFGLLGLFIFGMALGRLVIPLHSWRPPPGFDRFACILFWALFGTILWQGCFTPYTNWSDPIIAYPTVVLAAYCHRTARLGARQSVLVTVRG